MPIDSLLENFYQFLFIKQSIEEMLLLLESVLLYNEERSQVNILHMNRNQTVFLRENLVPTIEYIQPNSISTFNRNSSSNYNPIKLKRFTIAFCFQVYTLSNTLTRNLSLSTLDEIPSLEDDNTSSLKIEETDFEEDISSIDSEISSLDDDLFYIFDFDDFEIPNESQVRIQFNSYNITFHGALQISFGLPRNTFLNISYNATLSIIEDIIFNNIFHISIDVLIDI